MTLTQFLTSDFFWSTVVGTWAVQLLGTAITRRKPKSVLFWRVVRALHGLFDRIDPPGTPGTPGTPGRGEPPALGGGGAQ